MKKILTIAMAMFSMVAILSSCSKSEDDNKEIPEPEPQPEKVVKYNVRVITPLTDVQREIMDLSINYTLGGISATITPDKMQTMSLPIVEEPFKEATAVGKPTSYYYDLPDEYTLQELLDGTIEYVATGKPEGIAKYINSTFTFFSSPGTFIKPVDEEWTKIDDPQRYRGMEAWPRNEKEMINLINLYNMEGEKKHFASLK